MLQLKEIRKKYKTGELVQDALDNVSLNLRECEFVAILGPSGSGKTTLLNIIGGLDRYDSGDLIINGISTKKYSDRDWDSYRNHSVGFVFQSYNLIPHQTILANVELALTISGVSKPERRARAAKALEKVGLGDQLHKHPTQLSGGQMQRVAIARALVNNPDILLADEPTGALDSETSLQVMALLKDVAKDRLVVMVTHNPELAEHYATRIVKLRDGKIISDTQPFEPDEATLAKPVHKIMGHASMSMLTSLTLSFNNLLTKKARTLLTAFAGSIGIIGIALILALSTGVNNYVDGLEQSMLSAYPLQVSTSGLDLSTLFSTGTSKNAASAEAEGKVSVYKYITKMVSGVSSNDLKSFKAYLDSGESDIQQNASLVEYDYDVSPQIYRVDADGSSSKVNPDSTLSALGLGTSSSMFDSMTTMMTSSVFSQMPENEEVYKPLYEVKAGRWPENANECVVALGRRGDISDYALYALGLRDSAELDKMIKQYAQNQNIDVPTDFKTYSYSEFIGLSFKVVNSCDYYVYDSALGVWQDKSNDTAYIKSLVENGQTLTVVGVVQPIDHNSTPVLNSGVVYTPELTEQAIEAAQQSDIVKAQLSDPEVNVLTGEKFSAESTSSSLDLTSLFTVDTDAIKNAFKIDQSAVNIDLSDVLDLSSIDFSSLISSSDIKLDLSAMPNIDISEALKDVNITIPSSQLDALSQKVVAGYKDYVAGVGILHINEMGFDSYMQTDEFKQLLASSMQEIVASSELKQQVSEAMQKALQNAMAGYSDQITAALKSQLEGQLTTIMQKALAQLEPQLQNAIQQSLPQLSSQIENAIQIDTSVLKSAVRTDMSEEDLTSLLKSMLTADSSSYEANLSAFGYADKSNPSDIKIYPRDFDAKNAIIASLDAYNASMEAQGESGKSVQYTDIVGTLMTSVTDIISVISTILIVFVSISLVVSSIMIGVITYISVIERSKEIGILRAMGASKRNVSNVFNAETFIIGLFSGVLGIVLSRLLLIPANILINYLCANSGSGAEITAVLPLSSSLFLILLATLLTVLSGSIPARSAAKCNPVTALRSE